MTAAPSAAFLRPRPPSLASSPSPLSPLLVLLVLLSSFLLLFSSAPVSAQSYVPQVPALQPSVCTQAGQSFVSLGSVDSGNSTLFPFNSSSARLGDYWYPWLQYVYVTSFSNVKFGAVMRQLAVGLLDNSRLYGPVRLRLGLYLFQSSQASSNYFNEAVLLGQTDEITLYPSKAQVLYADLLSPVQLLDEGDYGIGIYASDQVFIAGGPPGSGYSGDAQYWWYTWGTPHTPHSAPTQRPALHPSVSLHLRPPPPLRCVQVTTTTVPPEERICTLERGPTP